jgi:esterase/lipase superfamily enzyme
MRSGLKSQALGFLAAGASALLAAGCVPATVADLAPTSSLLGTARPAAEPLELGIFIASTRPPPGSRAHASDGRAHFALNMISIPPGHKPGQVELPAWGKPNVRNHFVVTRERGMGPQEFSAQVASHVSGRVGADRDVLVFVHGFNTGYDEARLRLAQIVADSRFGGVPILFTWASANNLFAYESDKQAATVSRDALGQLLTDLSKLPGVGRVHVLAHSMGGWLAMEAMRESAIAGNGTLNGRLGEIMLAAPDIDIGVFRQQMTRLQGARVSVFSTPDDRALNLSSRLAGQRPRVGAVDPAKPQDRAELQRMGVRLYDLSQFSSGFIRHGVYADAPEVVRTIGAELTRTTESERNRTAVIDAGVTRQPEPPVMPGPVETRELPATNPETAVQGQ